MHENNVHPAAAVAADAIRNFNRQVGSHQRRAEDFAACAKGNEIPEGVAILENAVSRLTDTVAGIEVRLDGVLRPQQEVAGDAMADPARSLKARTTLGAAIHSAAEGVDAMSRRLQDVLSRLAL